MKRVLPGLFVLISCAVHAQDPDPSRPAIGMRPPVVSLQEAMQAAERAPDTPVVAASASEGRQIGVPGLSSSAAAPTPHPEGADDDKTDAGPELVEASEGVGAPASVPAQPPMRSSRVSQVQRQEAVQHEDTDPVSRDLRRLRGKVKPAPAELVVESGENHLIGVAYSHLNRIITPFPTPVVKTTSLATTSAEGSIVYVATNLSEPIGLFIHDASNADVAISLTLVPAEIPPVSTRVHVRGYTPGDAPVIAVRPDLAAAFDQQHAYLDALKAVLRELALGRVPDGYGFQALSGYLPDMPRCVMPGIHIVPLQQVTGTTLKVVVGRAHNTSQLIAEVREDACRGNGLRAVAAWPRTTLSPGESAELYLVLEVPQTSGSEVQRPSLLGGAP